ncbi:MAG: SDR family oxidoreductase [Bacteroidia bacterium]|nr:SDR family oxidoreductase [Bacteroidia bacterium]
MRYWLIGGSHGIGRSLVDLLLQEGHEVIVFARTRGDLPPTVQYFAGDILKDELPPLQPPLHGLVYLPGSITLRPFHQLREADFLADWHINCGGAIRALQHAYKVLRETTEGVSVVLVSTVAVQVGMAFHASIAAAKGALEGLVRSLAAEWAPSIRVNAVAPSLTQTPLAAKLLQTPERLQQAAQRHPLRRIGTPQDIAAAIAFLLSPHSSWITGQVLFVDGGLNALRII